MFQNQYEADLDVNECHHDGMNEHACQCGQGCHCCGCDCCDEEGSIGPMEPQGIQGPRGAQGPRGLQGQQGREGLQGIRGPQGVTGQQGEPGIQGASGPVGPRGLQGNTGVTGVTGAIGAQGPQGVQGNIGPAGQDAVTIQFASASLQSFTSKEVCPQKAIVFDRSDIQKGFSVSKDYTSLCAQQQGTYVIQFGCYIDNDTCRGDAIAIELNNMKMLEESRMPAIGHSFVSGSLILTLRANDIVRIVSESQEGLELCSMNHTINAYLIIYQINS